MMDVSRKKQKFLLEILSDATTYRQFICYLGYNFFLFTKILLVWVLDEHVFRHVDEAPLHSKGQFHLSYLWLASENCGKCWPRSLSVPSWQIFDLKCDANFNISSKNKMLCKILPIQFRGPALKGT
jgi:hypothetical protein